MNSRMRELFEDRSLVAKVKTKLPHLFTMAELESSRGGSIGMEVGSLREKILIALLIYKFGTENVDTDSPITRHEVDVLLFGQPVSFKSITGEGGVKVSWTVDAQKVREFAQTYHPICDIFLTQIKWDLKPADMAKGMHPGGLFWIPLEVQQKVLQEFKASNYLSLPRSGTNPRGITISEPAMQALRSDQGTMSIEIIWKHTPMKYDPYKRWLDYWKE